MINKFIFIFSLGATFTASSFASCKSKMKDIHFFHTKLNQLKVRVDVTHACGGSTRTSHKIEKTAVTLFENDKEIFSYSFKEGVWNPTTSQFTLKNSTKFVTGCLKGIRDLNLNLQDGYINSLQGIYINLKSKKQFNVNCLN